MNSKSMVSRILIFVIAALSVASLSCGLGDFNEGRCRNAIESSPVRLDGEQVVLSSQQIECGVSTDLWESPQQLGDNRTTARINSRARALKFDDDVVIIEPGQPRPHVQIRGEFPLTVMEIVNIRDDEPGVKLIEVRLGIVVQHSCFSSPIPLMGVRKGSFSKDVNPVVRLKQENGGSWTVDRLVH